MVFSPLDGEGLLDHIVRRPEHQGNLFSARFGGERQSSDDGQCDKPCERDESRPAQTRLINAL
jgi:hypothetical protein